MTDAYVREYLRDAAAGATRPPRHRDRGRLRDVVRYPYADPDAPDRTVFWHCRARVVGDPARQKHFWYLTADPDRPGQYAWQHGTSGHPGPIARRCLFALPVVRRAIRARAKWIVWAEGEKDACTAGRLMGAATSHHGGAGKATEEQAEHFRGYRGTVLVAVDHDDAGAACGLRRYRLLRKLRVRAVLVGPAEGVRTAGGPCGDRPCDCEAVCPVPSRRGADLSDHVAAGYGLSELSELRPGDLGAAAERWAASEAPGRLYGAAVPDGFTPAEWAAFNSECAAAVKESPLLKNGWNFILRK